MISDAPAWLLEQIASSNGRERRQGAEKWRVAAPLPAGRADEIRSALEHIDRDDRTSWLRVGMAVHSEHANEAGFALWSEWSKASPKYDAADQRHAWDRMDSYGGVTLASIFGEAMEKGWVWDTGITVSDAPDVDPYEPPDVAGLFPDELVAAGRVGLLREMCLWVDECAHKAQPLLSLVASIATLGAVYGRAYETETGLRTNIYTIGIAPSGFGKDNARKCIKSLLSRAGAGSILGGEQIGSGAGLLSAFEESKIQLFLLDEIAHLIAKVGQNKAASWEREIATNLMTLYTTSDNVFTGKALKGNKATQIVQPHPCVYGTTTPAIYDKLQAEDTVSGFLNRILLFPVGGDEPPDREPTCRPAYPPSQLVAAMRYAWEIAQRLASETVGDMGNVGNGRPNTFTVPNGAGVKDVWRALGAKASEAPAKGVARELWSRCREQAMRLALIRSLARDQKAPEVSRDDAQWGADVAAWCVGRLAHDCEERIGSSAHEGRVKRILRLVRSKPEGLRTSEITARTRDLTARERKDALSTLLEAGDVVQSEQATKGRPATVFKASRPTLH